MSSMTISKPKLQHDQHGYYIGREKILNGIAMPYSRESKYFGSEEVAKQAIEFGFYFRDTDENIALFEKYKSDYILYDGFFVKLA